MAKSTSEGPKAEVTRIGDRDGPRKRFHIAWPAGGATDMTMHSGAFTVVYDRDGVILRRFQRPNGTVQEERQEVKRGVRYTRPAGTRQQVINLSEHPLEADKDEDVPPHNPDDTVVVTGPA
jgi:mannose-6-phosphate isomerase-like protein (cupin superfamily)